MVICVVQRKSLRRLQYVTVKNRFIENILNINQYRLHSEANCCFLCYFTVKLHHFRGRKSATGRELNTKEHEQCAAVSHQ